MRAYMTVFIVAAIASFAHAAIAALEAGRANDEDSAFRQGGRRSATFLGLSSNDGSDSGLEANAYADALIAASRSMPKGDPPSPEALKVSQEWYLIQRVGVQNANGGKQPRSPLASNTNHCLTKGSNTDDVGGVSLVWQPCQDDYLAGNQKVNPDLQELQLFRFTVDGRIQAKSGGGCVRHVDCGDNSIYDLGSCVEEDLTVSFKIKKAIANSVDHLKPMGNPVQAIVADNNCDFCGPYQVTERCPGRRLPSGGCQKHWAAQPGWTKMSTQYIGDMATIGRADIRDPGQFAAGVMQNIRSGGVLESGREGFGPTGERGDICGSGSTEAPGSRSFYYFIRERKGQSRIAGTR